MPNESLDVANVDGHKQSPTVGRRRQADGLRKNDLVQRNRADFGFPVAPYVGRNSGVIASGRWSGQRAATSLSQGIRSKGLKSVSK